MKKLMKKVAAWSSETKVGVVIGLVAVVFFTTLAITTGGDIPLDTTGGQTTNVTSPTTNPTTSIPNTSVPVFNPLEEVMGRPYVGNVQTVRYFFDVNAPVAQLEEAIVFYNNKYEPSKGMDFALNNTQFNVIASLSGVVTSKVSDPVFGLTVTVATVAGDKNIEIVYSSLSSANVQVGQEVSKSTVIGKAGEAVFGSDLQQNHLHFRMKVNSQLVNPQQYFGVAVKNISG